LFSDGLLERLDALAQLLGGRVSLERHHELALTEPAIGGEQCQAAVAGSYVRRGGSERARQVGDEQPGRVQPRTIDRLFAVYVNRLERGFMI
jgi:hypothetical protein